MFRVGLGKAGLFTDSRDMVMAWHSRFTGFEMGAGMSRSQPTMPDFGVPSPARMYDYYLGGKDHFPADREAAERVIAAYPQARTLALANRRFLERAVKFLAGKGIRQFIDLGTGLPTSPNVHEVAQGIQQDARVVYVDNDPVVTVHGRALCGQDDGVTVIDGDIRQPEAVFTNSQLTDRIDLSQPVALLCVAVLHFITEDEQPRKIVAALQRQMVPGSYLVISHVATDGADKTIIDEITDAYLGATSPVVPRAGSAIRDLFNELDLAAPGLTDVARWRCTTPAKTGQIRVLGGVGRKRLRTRP
ncbi:SAM-dependent methyltransferase [Trebonia kvetii]|uniref:SAM-dependent methyltransferase n=1 Tax=Trebonia kvetii TaxID=2480626 RepID=A0A6P2BR26_9ACTN|nr:SAM-dependent methyltransferase [Trebonia kvetii]TVY99680.1 SAM-dependent methyltransferase [Trebonia kvetii]